MKIYYQGIPGAYSHQAGQIFGEKLGVQVEGINTFKNVFEKVVQGELGIIPIENSYAGSVHENFHHLAEFNVKIIGEYYLPIHHCLLGTKKEKIDKVYSHPQALMQCEQYLINNNIEPIPYIDTARAAQFVKQSNEKNIGAISSKHAAQIYNLEIFKEEIQDQQGNTTRFLLISNNNKFKNKLEKSEKISIIFKTKNIPAALYKCMGAFATRFINLTKLESLPAKNNPFEYMFWLDCENKVEKKYIDEALEELQFFSKELKIIGNY